MLAALCRLVCTQIGFLHQVNGDCNLLQHPLSVDIEGLVELGDVVIRDAGVQESEAIDPIARYRMPSVLLMQSLRDVFELLCLVKGEVDPLFDHFGINSLLMIHLVHLSNHLLHSFLVKVNILAMVSCTVETLNICSCFLRVPHEDADAAAFDGVHFTEGLVIIREDPCGHPPLVIKGPIE